MGKLVRFQFSRAIESRKLILSCMLVFVITAVGLAFCKVYYMPLADPRHGMYAMFLSFTQFFYLAFGYVLISLFCDDYQSGSIELFKYLGYSANSIIVVKIIYFLVSMIPLFDFIVLLGALVFACVDVAFVLKLIILLDLCIIQVMLIACALSVFIRKTSTATIIMYGLFLALNILNLAGFGLTNQADSNSLSSFTMSITSGIQRYQPLWHGVENLNGDQLYFYSILINVVWIIFLLALCFYKERKRGMV